MSIGKIILGIVFLVLLSLFTFYKPQTNPIPKTENPVGVVEVEKEGEVTLGDNTFNYVYFISGADKTSLFDNFSQKRSSLEISTQNKCSYGINGSFFDEKRQPLAGWETNGSVVRNITNNSLLNGYIGISNNNRIWLGKDLPSEEVRWGMQAGPILLTNGQPNILSMKTDKPARRNVAGNNKQKKLVFLSIFEKDSRYDGPTMEMLPEIVNGINIKENLGLISAINLDGGSASAYYSPEYKLPELVAVGSWICITE